MWGWMSYFSFSGICMLLSEPRCYLFSQNTSETCGKDQSTVPLEVERLEDSGQLVIFKNTLLVPYVAVPYVAVPYVAVPSKNLMLFIGIIISIVSLHLKCCFAQLTGRGAAHMSFIDA